MWCFHRQIACCVYKSGIVDMSDGTSRMPYILASYAVNPSAHPPRRYLDIDSFLFSIVNKKTVFLSTVLLLGYHFSKFTSIAQFVICENSY